MKEPQLNPENTKRQNTDEKKLRGFVREVISKNHEYFCLNSRKPRAFTRTFGCQQNVSDMEKIRGVLERLGYDFTDHIKEADLILYNTCAVRENAENRVFGNIGVLKHLKAANSGLITAICGCMPKQPHITEKIKRSYPYVDIVFGTNSIHRLPEFLFEAMAGRRVDGTDEESADIVEGLPALRGQKVKAFVPIMYGCDNFCSYCIVPFVRGRERSRPAEKILEEIRNLIAEGCREVTLLGQNVNAYGKGLASGETFASLLQKVNALEGEFRIRFMTSHPKDFTPELIEGIAAFEKVCSHIHLPVQSGSDRILALMNRGYDVKGYLRLIEYAKERIPGVSFTSDIIVGFPGETYDDFQMTLDLIQKVEFDSLFTFIYSKREGTKAASMEDNLPHEEKSRWLRELLSVQNEIGMRKYSQYIGRKLKVLAEGAGKSGSGYLTGRTENNIIVEFQGNHALIGNFVEVHIREAMNWALKGEI